MYHTSDTYVLGTALNAFVKQRLGARQDVFADVVVGEVWQPLGLSPVTAVSRRTYDAVAQPFTGWGLVLHRDDVVRIAHWLATGRGELAGRQLLQPGMLAAALQQVPADRGLTSLGPEFRYHHGFWARDLGSHIGCAEPAWVPFALGIGANTTVFSLVNSVLLRPLPFPEPERLVFLNENNLQQGFERLGISYPDYLDWRRQNQVFEDLRLFGDWMYTVSGGKQPERVPGAEITASLFALLGIQPILGRTFTADEDQPVAAPVARLGYGLWQGHFGAAPDIVGQTITLDGRSHTVMGVMPPGFAFQEFSQVWTPLVVKDPESQRGTHAYAGVARLKAGVTVEEARAEMNTIAARIGQEHPKANAAVGAVLGPLREEWTRNGRELLWLMLGAVGFVLAVAWANVVSLCVARATTRQKEFALRAALGLDARALEYERVVLEEGDLPASAGHRQSAVRRIAHLHEERVGPHRGGPVDTVDVQQHAAAQHQWDGRRKLRPARPSGHDSQGSNGARDRTDGGERRCGRSQLHKFGGENASDERPATLDGVREGQGAALCHDAACRPLEQEPQHDSNREQADAQREELVTDRQVGPWRAAEQLPCRAGEDGSGHGEHAGSGQQCAGGRGRRRPLKTAVERRPAGGPEEPGTNGEDVRELDAVERDSQLADPFCKRMERDNQTGKFLFKMAGVIQKTPLGQRVLASMISSEQKRSVVKPYSLSMVLWDMLTGGAPYRDVLLHILHPVHVTRFLWRLILSLSRQLPTRTGNEKSLPLEVHGVPDHQVKEEEIMDSRASLGRMYQDSEAIVRQGETGNCMYVIKDGYVEVVKETDCQEVTLAVLGENDFFGEMAIFENEVRAATVRAIGPARVADG